MQSPQSGWSKEQALWEQEPVRIGDSLIMPTPREQGGRFPRVFEEYPKAMYRAERALAGGGVKISAQIRVGDATEERQRFGLGWRASQQDALDLAKADELDVATIAANRAFQDRRMSLQAQAEAQAVEETSARHTAEIPRTPVTRADRKTAQPEGAKA